MKLYIYELWETVTEKNLMLSLVGKQLIYDPNPMASAKTTYLKSHPHSQNFQLQFLHSKHGPGYEAS